MIAVMPDFARIDRELAAIGTVPEAVQPLLDLYGQRDRSLENVDLVLDALREGREPISSPPDTIERPSFLPLGWDADRKSEPGIEALAPGSLGLAAPLLPSEREEITVSTGAPDAMFDGAPVALAAPAIDASDEPAAVFPPPMSDDSSPGEMALEGHIDTQQSSPPPPAEAEPSVAAAPASIEASEPAPYDPDPEVFEQRVSRSSRPPRPDLQALLDAELDPREFPSTTPPPKLTRSSLPPPVTSPLPPKPSEPAADELELLVDDDDILEIEDEAE